MTESKKALGTAHLAMGDSAGGYGGTVVSDVHLDGIVMTPRIEVFSEFMEKNPDVSQEIMLDALWLWLLDPSKNSPKKSPTISENQSQYSVTWRGNDWRITDVIESNDRMNVTLLCYRNAPGVSV